MVLRRLGRQTGKKNIGARDFQTVPEKGDKHLDALKKSRGARRSDYRSNKAQDEDRREKNRHRPKKKRGGRGPAGRVPLRPRRASNARGREGDGCVPRNSGEGSECLGKRIDAGRRGGVKRSTLCTSPKVRKKPGGLAQ